MKTASRTARKSSSKAAVTVKSAAARSSSRKPSKAAPADKATIIYSGVDDTPKAPALYAVVIANSQDGTERVCIVDADEERCHKYVANYSDPKIRPPFHHAEVRRIEVASVVDEAGRPLFKDAKPIDDKAARLRAAATAEPFATVARQFRDWLAAMSAKSTGGTLPAKALAAAFDQALFGVFCALDDAMMEAGGTKGYAACNCATNSGEAR